MKKKLKHPDPPIKRNHQPKKMIQLQINKKIVQVQDSENKM